jgi:hypothetical protein
MVTALTELCGFSAAHRLGMAAKPNKSSSVQIFVKPGIAHAVKMTVVNLLKPVSGALTPMSLPY